MVLGAAKRVGRPHARSDAPHQTRHKLGWNTSRWNGDSWRVGAPTSALPPRESVIDGIHRARLAVRPVGFGVRCTDHREINSKASWVPALAPACLRERRRVLTEDGGRNARNRGRSGSGCKYFRAKAAGYVA